MMFLAALLALLATLLTLALTPVLHHRLKLLLASRRRSCAAPPSRPSRDSIFGLDTIIQDVAAMKQHRLMALWHPLFHTCGKTYGYYLFGRRTICTADARNAQFVLATAMDKFGVGPARAVAGLPLVGLGVLTTDGKAWREGRDVLMPVFAKSQIADRGMFERHVGRCMDGLRKRSGEVDLQPYFEELVLNASSEFIFGESPDRSSDEASAVDAREFNEAFKYGQGVVGLRVFLGKLRFLIRDKEFWTRCKLIQDYTKRAITRSLQREVDGKGASKYNLVKELAAHSKNSDALSGHLLNVFIAGRDTPAVAMVNVLFCLARCPAAWAKIREEVAGLVPEDLSFEKLKSMRYLQHCINEGLRLYPALPTVVRVCLSETEIPYGGGPDGSQSICVVPGDTVTCNIYTLHRNPDVFGEDVESFRPERWKDIRPGWNYLPFSGGGRYCPAQQLSLFWVSHVIARMAMEFAEIVNKDPVEEYVENIQLTMESLNGVKVALVPA